MMDLLGWLELAQRAAAAGSARPRSLADVTPCHTTSRHVTRMLLPEWMDRCRTWEFRDCRLDELPGAIARITAS